VHTYQPLWPQDRKDWRPPRLDSFTFRSADDVGAYAALDALNIWYTYPHIWHLTDDGRFNCCSKGSSLDSVARFAENPEELLECRWTDVEPECPDNWVILEPRHEWLADRYEVTEDDARAFVQLRRALQENGISLLDAVIFDQEFHWRSHAERPDGDLLAARFDTFHQAS